MNSCGLALFFGFVFFVLALAGLFCQRARRRALEREIDRQRRLLLLYKHVRRVPK